MNTLKAMDHALENNLWRVQTTKKMVLLSECIRDFTTPAGSPHPQNQQNFYHPFAPKHDNDFLLHYQCAPLSSLQFLSICSPFSYDNSIVAHPPGRTKQQRMSRLTACRLENRSILTASKSVTFSNAFCQLQPNWCARIHRSTPPTSGAQPHFFVSMFK